MVLPGDAAHDQERGDQRRHAEAKAPGLVTAAARDPEGDADDGDRGGADGHLGDRLSRAPKEIGRELRDTTHQAIDRSVVPVGGPQPDAGEHDGEELPAARRRQHRDDREDNQHRATDEGDAPPAQPREERDQEDG